MKNIKKILIVLISLAIIISVSACNNSESDSNISQLSPADITEEFFSAFESSNYETMKSYCTESCIEDYFHGDDVFGMIWAKAVNIEKEPVVSEEHKNQVFVFVSVEMETAKTSALYPSTETAFYVVLEEIEEDSFLIDGFVTGL